MMGNRLQIQGVDAKVIRRSGCYQHAAAPNRNGSYEDHVMAAKALPSPEVLRQLLRYDPDTGKLFWRERGVEFFSASERRSAQGVCNLWNAKHAGREAFTAMSNRGYKHGRIFGVLYSAHRIIFKMICEDEPENIDHINRDRADNRAANLRASTGWQNSANTAEKTRSTSRFRGVYKPPGGLKWLASIRDPHTKRRVHLGVFSAEEDAAMAYDRAAQDTYGDFAVTNAALTGEGK